MSPNIALTLAFALSACSFVLAMRLIPHSWAVSVRQAGTECIKYTFLVPAMALGYSTKLVSFACGLSIRTWNASFPEAARCQCHDCTKTGRENEDDEGEDP
jgi:hypothetical protein